jgi:putative transferase (TIGR04331 family)
VGMMVPRYSYWMYSIPVGAQTLDYLEDQKRFAEAVSSDARDLLIYRMPAHDFGWDQKERLGDLIPSLKLYAGKKSFYQQLKEARLCINTCNSTPYLETFAANFPTLIFWNPKHWELRPSVRPYFDEMREAGILHDTPESAAAKIDEIYQNPQAWWSSPEIQKVRRRFCDQFARTSPKWLAEWKRELQKLTGK